MYTYRPPPPFSLQFQSFIAKNDLLCPYEADCVYNNMWNLILVWYLLQKAAGPERDYWIVGVIRGGCIRLHGKFY